MGIAKKLPRSPKAKVVKVIKNLSKSPVPPKRDPYGVVAREWRSPEVDLNVRSVRFVQDLHQDTAFYTSLPETRKEIDRDLCSKCARLACKARVNAISLTSTKLDAYNAKAEVIECGSYVPPIGFKNTKGLIDGCNTIRTGTAWAMRVSVGSQVGLVNVKTNRVIGNATVSRVCLGPKEDMLAVHARKNHLFIEQKITKKAACEQLTQKMPGIVGNLIWKNSSDLSVIYLEDVVIVLRDSKGNLI